MKTFEILNDTGENREDYFGAMSPPIIQTSKIEDFNHALKQI